MNQNMEYWQIILLGIVQGLTEFLPVSSSGHLILAPAVMGFADQGLALDTILHLATLLALIIYFRKDLLELLISLVAPTSSPDTRRLAWAILAATVPAGVAGLLGEDIIEEQLRSPMFVAGNLIVWSMVFFVADRQGADTKPAPDELIKLSFGKVLLIGVAQAIALLPGTSRSGITLAAGLFMGLSREGAARFCFLLGAPIILAAGGHKALHFLSAPAGSFAYSTPQLLAGFIAAFLSGYLAIKILMAILSKAGLMPFIIYRVILGTSIFLFL